VFEVPRFNAIGQFRFFPPSLIVKVSVDNYEGNIFQINKTGK